MNITSDIRCKMNVKSDKIESCPRRGLIFSVLIFAISIGMTLAAETNPAHSVSKVRSQPTASSTDTAEKYPWADVRMFGTKGNGVNDDTEAITRALTSSSQIIFLPPGVYRVTSSLIIPAGKSLCGSGAKSTTIQYLKDEGTAIKLNDSGFLNGFKLESEGKNQTGIFVAGVHPVLRNIEIHGFQNIGLRLGNAGVVGAYFAEIDNIFIYNRTHQGNIGILVDGQSMPNSNAI